ncbi:MAG: hypothetical protein CUR32_03015 [Flavobacterium sp.]|nr:MAG: hypothetical protein CUR32_03015 [Flavobacterium sp.] [Flavobacterium sp. FEMGT703F]
MKNALIIENIIKEISKAHLTIDSDTKDFLINGTIPQEVPQDFCVLLYRDFQQRIKLQLKENCSIELLKEYITQTDSGVKRLDNVIGHLRVNYVLAKSKDEVGENAESTIEYIGAMLKIKNKTLSFIKSFLENEIKYFGYSTSEDYKTFEDTKEPESDILISEKTERATLMLSRIESLVFLYTLEKSGILKFDNDSHREKFIENNFNYFETRNNKNKDTAIPIQSTKYDFPKLKSTHRDEVIPNNKVLDRLKDILNDGFLEFNFGGKS